METWACDLCGTRNKSHGSTASCAECGAAPEDVHASWCLAEEDRYDEILGSLPRESFNEEDPLAAEN